MRRERDDADPQPVRGLEEKGRRSEASAPSPLERKRREKGKVTGRKTGGEREQRDEAGNKDGDLTPNFSC